MGRKPKNETHEQWHENLRKRFEKYCTPGSDDECWTWTGAKLSKGGQYAMLGLGTHHNGVSKGAYVAAYIIYKDPHYRDYDKESFHHTCINSECVNPHHLRRMSHYENTLRQAHLAPGVLDKMIHEFPEAAQSLAEARDTILRQLGVKPSSREPVDQND